MLARFQDHISFVKDVAFNMGECTSKAYRFTSVGDDGLVCFWEFPVPSLPDRSLSLLNGTSDKVLTPVYHTRKLKNDLAILEPFAVTAFFYIAFAST